MVLLVAIVVTVQHGMLYSYLTITRVLFCIFPAGFSMIHQIRTEDNIDRFYGIAFFLVCLLITVLTSHKYTRAQYVIK